MEILAVVFIACVFVFVVCLMLVGSIALVYYGIQFVGYIKDELKERKKENG